MIDGALLDEYMATFYGYGSYGANMWLVGMQGVIHEELRPTSIRNLYLAKIGRSLCAFTKLPQAIADRDLQKVGTTLTQHLSEDWARCN